MAALPVLLVLIHDHAQGSRYSVQVRGRVPVCVRVRGLGVTMTHWQLEAASGRTAGHHHDDSDQVSIPRLSIELHVAGGAYLTRTRSLRVFKLDSLAGTSLAHKIMTYYPVLHYALPVARAVNWPSSCTGSGLQVQIQVGRSSTSIDVNRAPPPDQ